MRPIVASVAIAAPQQAVWDRISDIERAAERIPAIRSVEILSAQRSGLGTRWRETRIMFGKEATEVMEITEWRPPAEYVTRARSHGCDYRCTMRARPAGSGCTLEIEFVAIPLTLAAKLLGAVMSPLMRAAVAKALRGDLEAIRASVESGA